MGTSQLVFAQVVLPEVTSPEVTSVTWSGVDLPRSDRERMRNHYILYYYLCVRMRNRNCAISVVGPFDRKWRNETSPIVTGSCAISALVGPFHRKWRHHPKRPPPPPPPPPSSSAAAAVAAIALKFHPKHVTNKNKTKHIMKISHINVNIYD